MRSSWIYTRALLVVMYIILGSIQGCSTCSLAEGFQGNLLMIHATVLAIHPFSPCDVLSRRLQIKYTLIRHPLVDLTDQGLQSRHVIGAVGELKMLDSMTSVCQDMRCEGRYVALTSAGLPRNSTVTCLCVVTLRLAPSALLRYQSPGYPLCGIYYDWNQLRYSCRDGVEALTETFSQVTFHKTVATNNPQSLFQLSIDQQYAGSIIVRCYPPDSPISTTDHPTVSATSSPTLASSSEPTTPSSSSSSQSFTQSTPTSTTPNVSGISNSTTPTDTTTSSSVNNTATDSTTKVTVTQTPTHKPTRQTTHQETTKITTHSSTMTAKLSPTTLKPATASTSVSSNASTSSASVTHSTSTVRSSFTTVTSEPVSTPSSPSLSTVVTSPSTNISTSSSAPSLATSTTSTTEMSTVTMTTDPPIANETAAVTSYVFNKKVLLLSVAGGASGLFVLVLTVIIVAVIRRRRIKKQTLNSSQTSYIHAFDDPAEEPVSISSVFDPPDHTLASTSLPQVESSYPPSFHTISSGTLTVNYQWGSNDGLEDDTDLFVESGYPWEGDVDDITGETDQGKLDEGQTDSDIYVIMTRKGPDVKVEKHVSSLVSFQHK